MEPPFWLFIQDLFIFQKKNYLHNVLYIPQFQFNLISFYQLTQSLKCKIIFSHGFCGIQDHHTHQMIWHVKLVNNLYVLTQSPSTFNCTNSLSIPSTVATVNSKQSDFVFYIWYFRLGHPSLKIMQLIYNIFPYVTFNKSLICDSCHFAKQTKLPFPHSHHTSMHPFELLHMDIWGPINISSIQGHHYFLTIVDNYNRFTWLFLMKLKGETRTCITNFINYVQTQFSAKIKTIRSDNGLEFNMLSYFATLGILHQRSCVETPQHNSVVERKHKHLLNCHSGLAISL